MAFFGGWPGRFDSEIVALDRERNVTIPFLECIDRGPDAVQLGGLCRVGAPGATPSVLIWGDSHALAWLPAIDELLSERSLGGVFAAQSGCAPLVDVRNPSTPSCLDFNTQVSNFLEKDDQIRLVTMVASWHQYSSERGRYKLEDSAGRVGNVVVFPDAIRKTLSGIHRAGKIAWLIGPTPGAPPEAPLLMALARRNGGQHLEPVAFERFKEWSRRFREVTAPLSATTDLVVTDPSPWFCDERDCRFEQEGLPLYRDGGHLNVRGTTYLRPFLEPDFREAVTRAERRPGPPAAEADGPDEVDRTRAD
jgi:hypothetical protein